MRGRAPRRCARHLSCTRVHLDHFGNLRAFLALADSDLDAGALGHAAVPCCFQLTNVHECLGPTDHGDKPEALLGIEPFDDRFDRSRCSCRARTRIIWPNSRCSIVRLLIVVITAALRLTVVVFVTAHSTPVRLATTTISRFLHERSQEGRVLRSRGYWALCRLETTGEC